MFHAAARATYDAALCMYHDQALIPIKTLAFDHGVNVTLGLPFMRTSPDHGTAFDIAGSGRADPSSLIAALKLAARLPHATPAADAAMAQIDDLPPLRDVIRRHGLSAEEIARPELPARSQSDRRASRAPPGRSRASPSSRSARARAG